MGRTGARRSRQCGRRTSRRGGPVVSVGDEAAVTAANAEFYAAFEACDIDRMEAVWDTGDDIRCIHPGWPLLSGRSRVMRSWSVLMANTAYIQFFLTGVDVV